MKRLLFILLLAVGLVTPNLIYAANSRVSDLPAITEIPTGAEGMYIIDGGVSKQITVSDLFDFDVKGSGVVAWTGSNVITINADDTKFDIGEVQVAFINNSDSDAENHTKVFKTFAAQTEVAATYLTTYVGTWIGYNEAGDIIQSPSEFTANQRNSVVQIGRLGHFGKTAITGVFDLPWVPEMAHDWAIEKAACGARLLSGAAITENGANLKIDRSIGNFLRIGAGSSRNTINYPQSPSAVQVSGLPAWNTATQEAVLSSATTDIDPLHYDEGTGTLADVTDDYYSNIFILHFPYKSIVTTFFLYGNAEYTTLEAAVVGAQEQGYDIPIDLSGGDILASISVKKETTNLTTAIAGGTAVITKLESGGAGGGSSGTTYWSKEGTNLKPTTPGDSVILGTDSKLGLRTDTPTEIIHVKTEGGAGVEYGMKLQSPFGTSGGSIGILFQVDPNTGSLHEKAAIAFERTATYGRGKMHFLLNDGEDDSSVTFADDKIMTITPTGVCIGTDDASAKLDVTTASGGAACLGSYTTEAAGDYAVAMGSGSSAGGTNAVAMGFDTVASGSGSIAMGWETTAGGVGSIAMGMDTATAPMSNATVAIGSNITAGAMFMSNIVAVGLDTTNRICSQPNTMCVMGGKMGLANATPTEVLDVTGNIKLSGDLKVSTSFDINDGTRSRLGVEAVQTIMVSGNGTSYVSAANTSGSIQVAGKSRLNLNSTASTISGPLSTGSMSVYDNQILTNIPLRATSGTALAPGLSFQSDSNSGMYRVAEDTIALVTGGAEQLSLGTTTMVVGNDIDPSLHNHYDIGRTAMRWKDIHMGGSIQGGDVWNVFDDDGTARIAFGTGSTKLKSRSATYVLNIDNTNGLICNAMYALTSAGSANVLVASNGRVYRATSSRKIKENIDYNGVDPTLALQFKPVSFNSKVDEGGPSMLGFIAEDMRDIDPRFSTDGGEDDLPGLEMNAIVSALTALVQDQQKQIDELSERISILEP